MSPLVVAPQMAKPAANAQNVRTLLARLRTCNARTAAFAESGLTDAEPDGGDATATPGVVVFEPEGLASGASAP